jgi:hypothetical protein
MECVGRGWAQTSHEFGCKVSIGTPVIAPKSGQLCFTPRHCTVIRSTAIVFSPVVVVSHTTDDVEESLAVSGNDRNARVLGAQRASNGNRC